MTSTNGTFNNLYFEISSIIDPNGAGEANISNPSPPDPSELPDHCDNCIQDGDETGIDCGGSCYPCGIRDVLAIKSDLDLLGEKKSRYEIFAEPDPGTLLALKSGNSSLEAGMNIYLNGGFEVQKGATFYAGIEPELMSEPDRGCGNYCANAPDVQLTPDGDGINDYYAFSQAFAVEYDLRIFDRAQNTYYTSNNQPIYENGWIIAWDGTGAVPYVTTYYGTLILTDCNGNRHQENFYMTVYTNKSAIIFSDETNNKTVNKNAGVEIDTRKGGLIVYPNPFLNKLTINYSGKTFPLKYKITDLSGRVVIEKETLNNNESINMSRFSPGTYILNAKAGEYNLVQKLIKK